MYLLRKHQDKFEYDFYGILKWNRPEPNNRDIQLILKEIE